MRPCTHIRPEIDQSILRLDARNASTKDVNRHSPEPQIAVPVMA